ncbi:hypothetical protein HYH02_000020 [Chlamydomonas schloesseri]|uniref:HYR domain-containing protein n=1 Tax=Chlamydomonas schloesseri TaxID=2026947 RepID=A0A835WMF9_9CHLO|nr:hypothetical protein HYH02_000020 [Chlamydomonas schloesseri]|eukprot:KAG2449914.1 hypothetical protein HYH02_000020 [Chlamydomonas schloesseri]
MVITRASLLGALLLLSAASTEAGYSSFFSTRRILPTATNINECATITSPSVVCTNTAGSYSLVCATGYRTLDPVTKTCSANPCSAAPCKNGATCTPSTDYLSYTCTCSQWWTGKNCDVDVPECATNNGGCDPNATCNEVQGGAPTCTCKAGYKMFGTVCRANPCSAAPCKNGATCTPSTDYLSYTCTCSQWWTGKNCDVDVPECATNNGGCDPNATCNEVQGGAPTCTCKAGYKMFGTTCRANPCNASPSPCKNGATACTPTDDYLSQTCTCSQWWTGATCTQDVPECATNNGGCDPNATCNEVQGGAPTCTCNAGYKMFGTTCRANPCNASPSPCKNGATACTPTDDYLSQTCTCSQWWTGATCTQDVPECATNNGGCDPNATCNEVQGGAPTCTCNAGYKMFGTTCRANPCNASPSPCKNGATACTPTDDYLSQTCTCSQWWTGATCTQDVPECATNNGGCDPNATCNEVQGGAPTCTCKAGYKMFGTTCRANPCSATPSPCKNGGTCSPSADYLGQTCACTAFWQGATCEDDVLECTTANPCDTNASCTERSGLAPICTCKPGFSGDGKTCAANTVYAVQLQGVPTTVQLTCDNVGAFRTGLSNTLEAAMTGTPHTLTIVSVTAGTFDDSTCTANTAATATAVTTSRRRRAVLESTAPPPADVQLQLEQATAPNTAAIATATSATSATEDQAPPSITVPSATVVVPALGSQGADVDATSFNVLVTDNVDASVTATCTVPGAIPGSTTAISLTSTSVPFPLGDTTVTCTASDAATNPALAKSFIVRVEDQAPPSITVPSATVVVPALGSQGADVDATSFNVLVTDNVDASVTATCTVPGATPGSTTAISLTSTSVPFPLGDTTVTCTASDAATNPALAKSFIVRVEDQAPPSITVPSATVVVPALGSQGADVDATSFNVLVTDNVDASVTATCTVPGAIPGSTTAISLTSTSVPFPLGDTTVTCTASDAATNPALAKSFIVRVEDQAPPSITVPSATVVVPALGSQGADVDATSFNVLVTDNVDASVTATCTVPGATPGSTTAISLTSTSVPFPLGDTTVTCTASDAATNPALAKSFIVRVEDQAPPSITVPSATVVVPALGSQGADVDATSFNVLVTDNVDASVTAICTVPGATPGSTTAISLTSTSVPFPLGDTTVTCTASDAATNPALAKSFIVRVEDQAPPSITVPSATVVVPALGSQGADVDATSFNVLVTDNVDASVTATCTVPGATPGSTTAISLTSTSVPFPLGDTTVTCTASDAATNPALAKSFIVRVEDQAPPSITVPSATVVVPALGSQGADVDATSFNVLVTDNVDASVTATCTVPGATPGSTTAISLTSTSVPFPLGDTTVTCTASDAATNPALAKSFIVRVEDQAPPSITVPSATVVVPALGSQGADVDATSFNVLVTDNVDASVTATCTVPGATPGSTTAISLTSTSVPFPLGDTTVTCTASDAATNPALAKSFIVRVEDQAPPSITVPSATVVVPALGSQGADVDATSFNVLVTDNVDASVTAICTVPGATPGSTTAISLTSTSVPFPLGDTTVTCTASDAATNPALAKSFIVRVEDQAPPSITVPSATVVVPALGSQGADVDATSFNVLVTDNVDASVTATCTVPGATPGSTTAISLTSTSVPFPLGDTTVTCTASDAATNPALAKSFIVRVEDQAPPSITVPSATVVVPALGSQGADVDATSFNVLVTDNVDASVTATCTVPGATPGSTTAISLTSTSVPFPLGDTTVTCTASDAATNPALAKSFIVRVEDQAPPSITVPSATVVVPALGSQGADVDATSFNVLVTDNVDASVTATCTVPGATPGSTTAISLTSTSVPFPLGDTTVTCTASDAATNPALAKSFIVRVEDQAPPSITVPSATVVVPALGSQGADVDATSFNVLVTDNVDASVTAICTVPGATPGSTTAISLTSTSVPFPLGDTTVTCTASDAATNPALAKSFIVRVEDQAPPSITVPSATVVVPALGSQGADVDATSFNVLVTDNVDASVTATCTVPGATPGSTTAISLTSTSVPFPLGDTTVTCTASDAATNPALAKSFIVRVEDQAPPSITVPSATVVVPALGSQGADVDATSFNVLVTDNVDASVTATCTVPGATPGSTTAISLTSTSVPFPLGDTTVTCTASDAATNPALAKSFIVRVEDQAPPSITVPSATVVVPALGSQGADVDATSFNVLVTDNVDASVTATCTVPGATPGSTTAISLTSTSVPFPLGDTTVTCTASDAATNPALAKSFIVRVEDQAPPSITVPSATVVVPALGSQGADVDATSFNVLVTDNVDASVTAICTVPGATPGSTTAISLTSTSVPFPLGDTTVTCTASDAATNPALAKSFIVRVEDQAPPSITVPSATVVVPALGSQGADVDATSFNVLVTDNVDASVTATCTVPGATPGSTTAISLTSTSVPFPLGDTTVTCTASDAATNPALAKSFIVRVEDQAPPSITVPSATVVVPALGSQGADVDATSFNVLVTDNVDASVTAICTVPGATPGSTTAISLTSTSVPFPLGDTTVTCTASDAATNPALAKSFIVRVEDQAPPSITVPSATVVVPALGSQGADVDATSFNVLVTDNVDASVTAICTVPGATPGSTTAISLTSTSVPFPLGDTTVTCTASDAATNPALAKSFIVRVEDQAPPSITVPSATVVVPALGSQGADVDATSFNVLVTDNVDASVTAICTVPGATPGSTTAISLTSTSVPFPLGDTTVTCTASDAATNPALAKSFIVRVEDQAPPSITVPSATVVVPALGSQGADVDATSFNVLVTDNVDASVTAICTVPGATPGSTTAISLTSTSVPFPLGDTTVTCTASDAATNPALAKSFIVRVEDQAPPSITVPSATVVVPALGSQGADVDATSFNVLVTDNVDASVTAICTVPGATPGSTTAISLTSTSVPFPLGDTTVTCTASDAATNPALAKSFIVRVEDQAPPSITVPSATVVVPALGSQGADVDATSFNVLVTDNVDASVTAICTVPGATPGSTTAISLTSTSVPFPLGDTTVTCTASDAATNPALAKSFIVRVEDQAPPSITVPSATVVVPALGSQGADVDATSFNVLVTDNVDASVTAICTVPGATPGSTTAISLTSTSVPFPLGDTTVTCTASDAATNPALAKSFIVRVEDQAPPSITVPSATVVVPALGSQGADVDATSFNVLVTDNVDASVTAICTVPGATPGSTTAISLTSTSVPFPLGDTTVTCTASDAATNPALAKSFIVRVEDQAPPSITVPSATVVVPALGSQGADVDATSFNVLVTDNVDASVTATCTVPGATPGSTTAISLTSTSVPFPLGDTTVTCTASDAATNPALAKSFIVRVEDQAPPSITVPSATVVVPALGSQGADVDATSFNVLVTDNVDASVTATCTVPGATPGSTTAISLTSTSVPFPLGDTTVTCTASDAATNPALAKSFIVRVEDQAPPSITVPSATVVVPALGSQGADVDATSFNVLVTDNVDASVTAICTVPGATPGSTTAISLTSTSVPFPLGDTTVTCTASDAATNPALAKSFIVRVEDQAPPSITVPSATVVVPALGSQGADVDATSFNVLVTDNVDASVTATCTVPGATPGSTTAISLTSTSVPFPLGDTTVTCTASDAATNPALAKSFIVRVEDQAPPSITVPSATVVVPALGSQGADVDATSFNVLVTDNVDASVTAICTVPGATPGSTTAISLTSTSVPFPLGDTTVTCTASDAATNPALAKSFIVRVEDQAPPSITVPSATVVVPALGSQGADVDATSFNVLVTDNVDASVTAICTVPGATPGSTTAISLTSTSVPFPLGDTTVTCTASDAATNPALAKSFIVRVEDQAPPSITVPSATVVVPALGSQGADVDATSFNVLVTDNVDASVTAICTVPGATPGSTTAISLTSTSVPFPLGDTTVTCTASDAATNPALAKSFIVRVEDQAPPSITVPSATVVVPALGSQGADVDATSFNVLVTDNVDASVTAICTVPGATPGSTTAISLTSTSVPFPLGDTTVTCTASDAATNPALAKSFIVRVEDQAPPSITVPSATVVVPALGSQGADVDATSFNVLVTDNVDASVTATCTVPGATPGSTTAISLTSTSVPFPLGDTTVTCTASDAATNPALAKSFIVRVEDQAPPSITVPSATVVVPALGSQGADVDATSFNVLVTDNVDASVTATCTVPGATPGSTTAISLTSTSVPFPLGDTTVTCTASDAATNPALAKSFIVRVEDQAPPSITVPSATVVVPALGSQGADVDATSFNVLVTDNVDASVTAICTVPGATPGSTTAISLTSTSVPFPLGDTTVTCTASDAATNPALAKSFIVRVEDQAPPSITVPSATVVVPALGSQGADVDATSFNVLVTDNVDASVTATCTVPGATPGSTTAISLTSTSVPFPLGDTTVTCTASDAATNPALAKSFIVRVEDQAPPSITVPSATVVVPALGSQGADVDATSFNVLVTDNVDASVTATCTVPGATPGSTTAISLTSTSVPFPLGDTTVTCTASDAATNPALAKSFIVRVEDQAPPSITVPSATVVVPALGSQGADVDATSFNVLVTDNVDASVTAICTVPGATPGSTTAISLTSTSVPFPLGDTTVTCTASDAATNPALAKSFIVRVEDQAPPSITVPSATVVVPALGSQGADVDATSFNVLVTDNVDASVTATCTVPGATPGSTTAISLTSTSVPFPLGDTTVTCTASDAATNPALAKSFIVRVEDQAPPSITVPSATVVVPALGSQGADVDATSFNVLVTDNVDASVTATCTVPGATPGSTTAISLTSTSVPFPLGDTTVTCTASDAATNPALAKSFIVRVEDQAPPSITVPSATVVVPALGSQGADVDATSFNVLVTDNVDASVTAICTVPGATPGSTTAISLTSTSVPFPLGDTTVTCTASDAATNPALAKSFIVRVEDQAPPSITVPSATVVVPALGSQGADVDATSFNVLVTDNVDASVTATCTVPGATPGSTTAISLTSTSVPFPLGDTTVTCTASDAATNPALAKSFIVRVVDSLPPTISGMPANQNGVQATSAAGAVINYTPPTATDAVDGAVTPVCKLPGDVPLVSGTTVVAIGGPYTVTCTASDGRGNIATETFTVTVVDTAAPVFSNVPSNIANVQATGPSGAAVSYSAPTASDAVSGAVTPTCSPASGTTFPIATTTVTCTATDGRSNSATATFTVTVVDTAAPVFSNVPSNIANVQATGPSGAAVSYAAPTASDAVSGAVTPTCSPASGTTFPIAITTVTCTATDGRSNSATATFTVTVVDTAAPVFSNVPSNIANVQATGPSGAAVSYAAPTASDAVSGAVTPSCSPASGATFPIATTTVTCTATDGRSNSATATFTVTVVDTAAPVFSNVPSNIANVQATGPSGAAVSYAAPTASDAVSGAVTPTCSPASGTTFPIATTTVTCTATDGRSNSATATFTVTVVDTAAPVFSNVPSNIANVQATGPSGAAVSYAAPTASDAVSGAVTPSCSPASGTTFPIATTTVTCTATDGRSNSATATFTVTVVDTAAPVFSNVPSNIANVQATGPSGAAVSYAAPTASDAVSGAVTPTCSPASGTTFPIAITTVTCTATDGRSNSATATFTVTVVDTAAPVFSNVPSNIANVQATGPSGAAVSYAAPTASDAVSGAVTPSCSPASGTTFPIATTTVTCTATDGRSNSATATFTVTVVDTAAPVFSNVPSNIANVQAAGPSGANVTYTAPTANDAVSGAVTPTCSPASGATFPIATTTVTCTATDGRSNSATATFTVTVVDTAAPVFSNVPSNIANVQATGPSGAAVSYAAPTASDAVSGAVTPSCSPASGATFPIATTTVTCTATDGRSNSATATFTVTVVDTAAPVISGAVDTVLVTNTASGAQYSSAIWPNAITATDAVDGSRAVSCTVPGGTSIYAATFTASAATTVTCTAADTRGNTATRTFTVTVTTKCDGFASTQFMSGTTQNTQNVVVGQSLVITWSLGGNFGTSVLASTTLQRLASCTSTTLAGTASTVSPSASLVIDASNNYQTAYMWQW